MKLPSISIPTILKPRKEHKPYYYLAGLCVVYTPYFFYFPHPQRSWRPYVYVLAYIPLYFLVGFFLGGMYFLFYKRKKDRKMKEEKQREEDRRRIMEVTGGFSYTIGGDGDPNAGTRKPEKAFLPRKLNLVEKWRGRARGRGHGRLRSETLWDADEWRDIITLTDARDVLQKREEGRFDDIPLEEIHTGVRMPEHMIRKK
jgi:hypothetical protein